MRPLRSLAAVEQGAQIARHITGLRRDAACRVSENLRRPRDQPALARVNLVIKEGLIPGGAARARFNRDHRGGRRHPQRRKHARLQALIPGPAIQPLDELAKYGEAQIAVVEVRAGLKSLRMPGARDRSERWRMHREARRYASTDDAR